MAEPSWNKHRRRAWKDLAVQAGGHLDLTSRVLLVALDRLDRNGHAAFGRGELAKILASVDPATGEVKPVPRNSLSKAITRGVTVGMFRDGSASECVQIPDRLSSYDTGPRTRTCPGCERIKADADRRKASSERMKAAHTARPQRALRAV